MVDRLSKTVQNELMNIVVIFLGLTVGATATAEAFLNFRTLGILVLGVIAFCFSLTDLPLLTLLTDMATNGMSLVVPTVAAGLFWKKATPQGAIASMVTAEAVYLGLYASGVRYVWGGFFLGFPAIAVGIVVMIVVSLATQDKYYKAHAAQQGVFEDFFVRGRVSAWIRENMGTKAAK